MRLQTVNLTSGAVLMRARRRDAIAEKWGLLAFSDPDKRAPEANVFWKPSLLAGAIKVTLNNVTDAVANNSPHETIVLSSLKTCRILLDTYDGVRHILLSGDRFWIQLYSERQTPIGDQNEIELRLDGTRHLGRRLDTAAQLLSLHRSAGGKLSLIGRRKTPTNLLNAIAAFDIWHGFERPKGDLKEIAQVIAGKARVASDWGANDRALKAQARRAITRGERLVGSEYRDLLPKKTL